MEVVFYPGLRSASDAATAVKTLRNLLRHIGTCDGRMEEGSLRCDLNVSIAPLLVLEDDDGDDDSNNANNLLDQTGHRVEVKNLNSIRQVQQAAEYEAIQQAEAVVNGHPTGQETRTFDVKSGKTVVLRTKGGAKDYRFLPEPDLPPLVLDKDVSLFVVFLSFRWLLVVVAILCYRPFVVCLEGMCANQGTTMFSLLFAEACLLSGFLIIFLLSQNNVDIRRNGVRGLLGIGSARATRGGT
jgi:Glu-tRNA(Gln) amidotransferase subunit E-like FAD-binding protein